MFIKNGHVDPSSLRVFTAAKKIKHGDESYKIYLLEGKVVASQKTQYYWSRVCLSHLIQSILGRPYSSCECVVRRGPGCSPPAGSVADVYDHS